MENKKRARPQFVYDADSFFEYGCMAGVRGGHALIARYYLQWNYLCALAAIDLF